ncbi:MAG TPA: SH3 domain-containing protein [Gemmataceae bacterium]
MTASSLLLFALIGLSLDQPDTAVLQEAERCFAEGIAARHDASAARRWFARSAREYDDLWQRGFHNPALALNRARAHRLAGNLPAAIAALHAGLAVARFDRALQVELEDCRAAVEYPNEELAVECRPRPLSGIGSRMAPVEAFLLAGSLWLVACLCLARLAMTRRPAWLIAAAIALVALAALGGLWFLDWRQQRDANARPLAIVDRDCTLRTGNGTAWPNRFAGKLPRGVEARVLGRRGGWVQVELAAGAVGWLPESCLLPI